MDFSDYPVKEKEKSQIIRDPTNRFERSNEVICYNSHQILYKAYDRESGLEVTWNEILFGFLSLEQREKIIHVPERIMQIHSQTINSMLAYWMNESKDRMICITESLTASTVYSNIYHADFNVKPQVIARWFLPVLQSLHYLHTLNPPIIHGKIHPKTIFIKASSGSVKLISPSLISNCISLNNKEIRIHPTMPPELLADKESTYSDIYSFGMALLYTVTGKEPYEECKSPLELIQKISNYIPPDSLKLIGDSNLADLISQCLRPVSQRPTAADLMNHKVFMHKFANSSQSSQTSTEDELIVIFSGKPQSKNSTSANQMADSQNSFQSSSSNMINNNDK